jgi:hypothetical protein
VGCPLPPLEFFPLLELLAPAAIAAFFAAAADGFVFNIFEYQNNGLVDLK